MSLYRQVLLDSPVTYWPMDEASGAPRDLSVNQRAASYTNAPSLSQSMVTGSGVLFNNNLSATNQNLEATSIAADNITTGTLECWANIPTSTAQNTTLGRAIILSEGVWGFYIHNGVLAVFDWAASTWRDTSHNPRDGLLHHWVFTFVNGSTGTFYRDGVSVATVSSTGRSTSGAAVSVANQRSAAFGGSLANPLWATLGHVAIYNAVLSTARIQVHYQAGIRSGVSIG